MLRMWNKKTKFSLKFAYDAPVTLSFAFISIVLFVIDLILKKVDLSLLILSSPTSAKGSLPFELNNALSYFRILLYGFGGTTPVLIYNLIFVLLLGPGIEEKYGSVVIGIMMMFSSLFAGVLNSCFGTIPLKGCVSMVFMLIFLNSFTSFTNKKVPLSFITVFVLFILSQIYTEPKMNALQFFINIAGGLCGSLFAFLASPKAKSARKTAKKGSGLLSKAEQINRAEEIDSQSPRLKNKKMEDDDTTVVGTLKF